MSRAKQGLLVILIIVLGIALFVWAFKESSSNQKDSQPKLKNLYISFRDKPQVVIDLQKIYQLPTELPIGDSVIGTIILTDDKFHPVGKAWIQGKDSIVKIHVCQ